MKLRWRILAFLIRYQAVFLAAAVGVALAVALVMIWSLEWAPRN